MYPGIFILGPIPSSSAAISPSFSSASALFLVASTLCEGCSSFFSISCALFLALQRPQPLYSQPIPHSFTNIGGGAAFLLCCSSLATNSFRITSFADPHNLSPLFAYPFKKHRGQGSSDGKILSLPWNAPHCAGDADVCRYTNHSASALARCPAPRPVTAITAKVSPNDDTKARPDMGRKHCAERVEVQHGNVRNFEPIFA